MRAQHEYVTTGRLIERLSSSPHISGLKLRLFDPTQAFCESRIDKGLAEALMLKRAKCTIYLAQESDTLGKDSELASTLAQGKPVIAFVPEITDAYFDAFLSTLKEVYDETDFASILMTQLRMVDPQAAWDNDIVREWIAAPPDSDPSPLEEMLKVAMKKKYDSRARTLRELHPLGIQVNLSTGVANGVLVARDDETLARLVRQIVTRTLEFDLEVDDECIRLVENHTRSVYRVMTRDEMLTNTFWNFYLNPA